MHGMIYAWSDLGLPTIWIARIATTHPLPSPLHDGLMPLLDVLLLLRDVFGALLGERDNVRDGVRGTRDVESGCEDGCGERR